MIACTAVEKKPQLYEGIDWKNHSYGFITLENGYGSIEEFKFVPDGGGRRLDVYRLVKVCFGDIDGDNLDEAIVLIQEDTSYHGSTYTSTEAIISVYTQEAQDILWLCSTYEYGEIQYISIKDRTIIAKTKNNTYQYQYKNGKLHRVK
jgi:hypothetical protein